MPRDVQWTSQRGVPVLLEESHALPIVDVAIVLRFGALTDGPGLDGTARLLARLLRSGCRGQSSHAFDDAVESLGGTWSADVGHGSMRFTGAVLAKNLEPFLALVLGSLLRPALRPADLSEARREAEAELLARQDDDRWLAARAFRMHLFGDHPYGRSPFGSSRSLPKITTRHVRETFEAHVSAPNLVIGLAGAVRKDEVARLLDRHLSSLPRARAEALPVVPRPRPSPGRRLLFVHKPERSQAQLQIGTLGVRLKDPAFHPLVVANHAFGGSITSRLMRIVRTERGYSYSAGSRLGADVEREAFSLHSHPALEATAACAALELDLYARWVRRGLGARELAQTQAYLVKSHAFERDTAIKRLEPRIEAALHGLPRSFWAGFIDRVQQITAADIDAALAKLSLDDLSIVVLGTRSDRLDAQLNALPGVRELAHVEHHRIAEGTLAPSRS